MQLTLILDKSAFQSLSYKELYRLCQYYKVIVPPILVMEILGDLSKKVKEGNPPTEARVIEFAKKLFVQESVVIMDYRKIVHMDLMQHNIPLDRRPIVDVAQKSIMEDQVGFEVKESEEEKSINEWKQGKFTDAERVLSLKWRTTTTEPNKLDKLKKKLNYEKFGLNNIKEVIEKVDTILLDPKLTQNLLIGLCENYEIPAGDTLSVLQDWNVKGRRSLNEFSAFAFHCLRIDLLFLIGLTENIIGTRSTNSVDIKYLYHLPFTKIFSSSDKLHKQIVPFLLEDDQLFIEGPELKADMSLLIRHIETLEIDQKKQFYKSPPHLEKSLTFKLWRDFYGYSREDDFWEINRSPKELERVKEHIKKITESFENNIDDHANIEKADYMVKHSFIRRDDPCFCKSGNSIVGCCMTAEEFDLQSEISFFHDVAEGRITEENGYKLPSKEQAKMIIKGLKDGSIKPKAK